LDDVGVAVGLLVGLFVVGLDVGDGVGLRVGEVVGLRVVGRAVGVRVVWTRLDVDAMRRVVPERFSASSSLLIMDALPPPPRTSVLMASVVAEARHRRLRAKHPIFEMIMVVW
jgi:hypothetical protein